jgi:hypothetical protein
VAQRRPDVLEPKYSRIADTAATRNLHRQRGVVNCDYIAPSRLQLESEPSCSTANIENASPHKPQRATLGIRPAAKRREVRFRPVTRFDQSVVTLHDLARARPTLEVRQHQFSVSIASFRWHRQR